MNKKTESLLLTALIAARRRILELQEGHDNWYTNQTLNIIDTAIDEELNRGYLPCNCRFEGAEVGKVIVIKKRR